jgi:glycosyltransferase involved in cell wall biosynthesis
MLTKEWLMKRPTLSLCLIAKNEEKNVPQLFESIKMCFDEIIFVDTGSTDRTCEVAVECAERFGLPIRIEHFTWINDFSAARNFSLSFVKTDYAMWMDLDDVLDGRSAFIAFRNNTMEFCDFWLANYDYALKPDGSAAITFLRERIFKMSKKPQFMYFIHEGIKLGPDSQAEIITTWRVKHMRTEEDMKQDRSRNINIIEARKHELDSRLKFYYGKELYEAGQYDKAFAVLVDASSLSDLELHDRILAVQYACYSSIGLSERLLPEYREEGYARARQLAHQGLQLDPTRAEFYNIIGETYLKSNRLNEAEPFYNAALGCRSQEAGGKYSGPIFTFSPLYGEVPRVQLSKIYFHRGEFERSKKMAQEVFDMYQNPDGKLMVDEIERITPLITLEGPKKNVPDIVISCPPQNAYEFDEEIYKSKGLGGSETALIHMAKWLKKKTGRPVKVFNMRSKDLVADSGVEYISTSKLNEYFAHNMPAVHIAWRHNIKLTNAPTYLWCHDLATPGVEMVHNFDYLMCLTPFHKGYVSGKQGVPLDKIVVTRNGLDPEKFDFERPEKNPNKLVYMSSPDRGLVDLIPTLDIVRREKPEIELHVFYGIENLPKYGMIALHDKLKKMMAERPWIKYHGNTEQNKMYRMVADAVIWPHPANFIESFCITAIEMLCLGVYPITRRYGALQDTLRYAESQGMATMLDCDASSQAGKELYAKEILFALENKVWEQPPASPDMFKWEDIAEEWIEMMPLHGPERHINPRLSMNEAEL